MIHSIYRIVTCAVVAPYTLRIAFDDGAAETIDFKPARRGELYGPLLDRRLFEQMRIDPETQTLIWPNDADFDPATLHEWRSQFPRLIKQMECWNEQPASIVGVRS